MRLFDLVNRLDLQVKSARNKLDREVRGGYASDLLSDVIAHGREGDLWITLQSHVNIVAVASMKDLCGIILVGDRCPEPDTIEKARQEDVPLMVSRLPAFELAGRLYMLGLRGGSGE